MAHKLPFFSVLNLAKALKARLAPPVRQVGHYERVLGTALEVQIRAASSQQASQAEAAILTEIDRLEAIFSRFYPDSELNRWQAAGQEMPISPELSELLRLSQGWQTRTLGAFNPAAEALVGLWKKHAKIATLPSRAEIEAIRVQLGAPLWQLSPDGQRARKLGSVSLNFNAIAKGYIADSACQAARATQGVEEVLVNIGGDLRHWGQQPIQVAIEDPFSRADNAPPIARIQVMNQAVASSGRSRRGFQIGNQWFSHLIDPRSGVPVEQVVGASVIADDCATADVLATAFSVLEPQQSLALAESLPRVGCLLTTQQGDRYANRFWQNQERNHHEH